MKNKTNNKVVSVITTSDYIDHNDIIRLSEVDLEIDNLELAYVDLEDRKAKQDCMDRINDLNREYNDLYNGIKEDYLDLIFDTIANKLDCVLHQSFKFVLEQKLWDDIDLFNLYNPNDIADNIIDTEAMTKENSSHDAVIEGN